MDASAVEITCSWLVRWKYKAAWESSGSDGAKVAKTIGLKGVLPSHDEYIAVFKGGELVQGLSVELDVWPDISQSLFERHHMSCL